MPLPPHPVVSPPIYTTSDPQPSSSPLVTIIAPQQLRHHHHHHVTLLITNYEPRLGKRGVCFLVQQQPRVLLVVRVSTTVHSAVPSTTRKTCNDDKNLNEIQLEHEKEDELVTLLVKVVHELDCIMVVKEIENEIFKELEKLEWWFEQDIDDEGEEDEEDGGGDEI
nr:hypothetical protein [Tanacetum cinerariifolium]